MKAYIQIPKGWRKLKVGESVREGDREYCPHHFALNKGTWQKKDPRWSGPVGIWEVVIRRVKRKAKK